MMTRIVPTIKSLNKLNRRLAVLSIGILLGGCQPATNVESNLNFTPPERILQVRAINRNLLSPSVLLDDGTRIPMRSTGNNTWSGTINVQPNNTYFVSIEWIEALPEGNLVLAQWSQSVDVDDDGAEIQLSGENYDYNLDFDGDQITNLDERINETNPFVHNDQMLGTSDGSTDTATDIANTTSGATDGEMNSGDTTTGTTAGTADAGTTGDGTITDVDSTDVGLTDAGSSDDGDGENQPIQPQPTVLIPRISASDAPAIDGFDVEMNGQGELRGEWRDAVQFDNFGERLWINNLMIDQGADAEEGAELRQWAAMHDGVNLYVLVLSDDIGSRHADSIDFWEDDTLELFIDGDNSKLSEWGDDDDFQMLIPLLPQFDTVSNNEISGRFAPGPASPVLPLEFSTGPGVGPDGIRIAKWELDVYELSIPIATAGITIGSPFGLELQLNDDDNGGFRESKWGWFHPSRVGGNDTDLTYQNPSIMGTVVLQE